LIKGIYSFACHGKDTNQTSELAKNIQLLKAENIVFGVNGRRGKILDIPTLSLAAGRIIFVLGNNGAGKSSLLSFLAGRQYLPGASIWVKGRLLPPLSEKLMPGYRGIELIRQEPDLNPHFLVEEELQRHRWRASSEPKAEFNFRRNGSDPLKFHWRVQVKKF